MIKKEVEVPTYALVRDKLRQEIINGEIAPNKKLTISEITSRFNVSQMPVREALQYLEGEGLVALIPHKGARVVNLDKKFVKNIYDIRGALEGLMAQLCIPHLTIGTLNTLDELQEKMKELKEDEDHASFLKYNAEFHQAIYQHSDNPEAFKSYERYQRLLYTLRYKYNFTMQRKNEIIVEHKEIVSALREQDCEKVNRVVLKHNQGARDNLLQLIRE